jgi:AcrR family transcriptional regulator
MNHLVQEPAAKAARKPANKPASKKAPGATRTYDSQGSMSDILQIATAEFAEKGLAGARIDEIAAATRTSKRMIYYHYQSKEGLYLAVLEAAYGRIREIESQLDLADLAPEAALRKLVAFTFDYQRNNEDFIRLVMNENIHRGEFLAQSPTIQTLNSAAIDRVRGVYERGVKAKVFRRGIDAIDLHQSISALSFFNVSNRHTFSLIFKPTVAPKLATDKRRDSVVEMIVRFVKA